MTKAPDPERGGRLRGRSVLRTGARASERGGLLHDRGLAVRGLVLVDDALGGGLVELLGGVATQRDCLLLVAGLGGFAELAHGGLQAGLDGLVALVTLLVLLVPLDLALDVRHYYASCRFDR